MKSLTDEMKSYIQYGTEDRRWEFKPPMVWSKGKKKRKYEIVKAALALSNTTGGGFIVLGISQKRDRSEGDKFERRGLTAKQFQTFDKGDDLGRFLNEKTNQRLEFEIFGERVRIEYQDRKFVVIQIHESKNVLPVICTCDFKSQDPHCRIETGRLYIRSISSPIESRPIKTNEEWEELIHRLLSRKEEIIYKDLQALCKNVKFARGPQVRKAKKQSLDYERVLKRDNL